ncbi:MAG: hypothetical protein ACOCVG_01520 [Verrucomicrobiota bacterium]
MNSPFQFIHRLESGWRESVEELDSSHRSLETRRVINGFQNTASLQFYGTQNNEVELICAVDVELVPQRNAPDSFKYRFYSAEKGQSAYHICMPTDLMRLDLEARSAVGTLCEFLGIEAEPEVAVQAKKRVAEEAVAEREAKGLNKHFDVDKLVISKLEVDPSLGGVGIASEEEESAEDEEAPETAAEASAPEVEAAAAGESTEDEEAISEEELSSILATGDQPAGKIGDSPKKKVEEELSTDDVASMLGIHGNSGEDKAQE